ncbi:hypothetical protein [Actinomadura oligospora]|uniref:hypothetical protein n=1 Tax=Actinomadura oligospora TaxID=111804 RepID=UPI0004B223AD|nr:hypothetical protein [Actinomadura oligospora]
MELESTRSTRSTADGLDALGSDRCRVRLARGTRGRAALEVYVHGGLYDVTVADGFAPSLLRGAVRGRGWAVAWGQLPPGGAPVRVTFTGRRVDLPADVRVFGDRFWVAVADVRARSVVVSAASERVTSRLRTVRRRSPRP